MAVINIDLEYFRTKVFDYTKHEEWVFEGDKPVLIDFYADWCGPCKMLSPVLEELSVEFEGKVDILKIDTEKEVELSTMFGIRSIPSLLFVPKNSEPFMQAGVLPKHDLRDIIKKELLNN